MKSARILAAAPLAVALVAVGPATSAHSPTAPPTTVKVVMTDYDFALSKKRIVHGKAVFRVVNTGEVIHDFKIAGKKTAIFTTGQSGLLRVALKKPGRYLFVCTVPGHIAAGMKGTLTVR
jgi:uncharacterized cupredoxin-like copper-binding protein